MLVNGKEEENVRIPISVFSRELIEDLYRHVEEKKKQQAKKDEKSA